MKYNSPLFISTMELLAHSTELYVQKNDKKYKFIILHLANSVELILKDKMLSLGISIYIKNTNRTIGVWECFTELEKLGVSIPERPIIELLIDDRNTIQHRFGFPNGESVYYYLDHITTFFKRFLKAEYNLSLTDELSPHLKKEHLELLGLIEDENHHLNKLKEVSIEMAILNAYAQIETIFYKVINDFEDVRSIRSRMPVFMKMDLLIKYLSKHGKLDSAKAKDFTGLKAIRNNISHGQLEKQNVSKADLEKYFELSKEVLTSINKAKEEGFFTDEAIMEMLEIKTQTN